MDQCVASQCEDACGVQCGFTASYAEPDSAAACQDCVATNACAAARACGTDLTCTTMSECITNCATQDCFWGCAEAADASLLYVYGVATGACLAPCSIGEYWECAGHTTIPLAKSNKTTFTLQLQSEVDASAVTTATVKACALSDPTCTSFVASGTTDSLGHVTLTLPMTQEPYGFGGYFDISAPTFARYLLFLAEPLSEPEVIFPQVNIEPTSAVEALYAAAGVTADPSRGVLDVGTTDCHWTAAPHVQVHADTADAKTTAYYPSGGAYDATATSTDATGQAIFLNLPAGTVNVTATPLAIGRTSSKTPTLIRAGAVSKIIVRPNL
jgi:hypothetical protein